MNFKYIKEKEDLLVLYNYCNEAETFALSYAEISITAARKAIEYLVKLFYGVRISSEFAGMSLFEILSDNKFIEQIGNLEVLKAIHLIRRKGNHAVHEGNMTFDEAMEVLKKLHYSVGEICILLQVVVSYPTFNSEILGVSQKIKIPMTSFEETVVDQELILKLSARIGSNLKPASYAQANGQMIDIHANSQKASSNKKNNRAAIGTDSGANAKLAYQIIAKNIQQELSEFSVMMENVRAKITIIGAIAETIVVVKTGCPNIGTKNFLGEWQLLPGVDFVLYCDEIRNNGSIPEQFYVLSRTEFLQIWESLGLIRYKVSSGVVRKYKKILGDNAVISVEEYGDTMSVQSFTNSPPKKMLVMLKLKEYPRLTEGGYQILKPM